jgi:tRNA (cytidine/uridine-2'-O-)-methyltransferase
MIIVLYRPQIPQNCGNVVRTCAVTGSSLVLVRPLGFSVNDRWLKRAGLDYWEGVDVKLVDSLEEAIAMRLSDGKVYFLSSKASTRYSDVQYGPNDILVFGSETEGLPQELHDKWNDNFVTIPMQHGQRCLNLATSVGIVVYEAWRQQNFTIIGKMP